MAIWGLVVAGAVVLVLLLSRGPGRDATEDASPARGPVPVEAVVAELAELERTVRGVGSLRAAAAVELRAELAGRVAAIEFEEGGAVEQGQVLYRIDDRKLRRELAAREAALEAARVRVAHARRTLERQAALHEQALVPAEQLDQARAELDSAEAEQQRLEAELALVEQQLAEALVTAPFAGRMSERQVDPGAYVALGDPLATLYRVDTLQLAFTVPERHLGQIRRGQPVRVSIAAYPQRRFEGLVDFVSPAIDERTRDALVRASLPNPEGLLTPGAFAEAAVSVERREAVVVPEEALVATRQGFALFIIEDGRAYLRPVVTGLREVGRVEIREGLAPGQQVVRRGHLRLDDGQPVAVAGPRDGPPAGERAGGAP